jgi:hypothetical protein
VKDHRKQLYFVKGQGMIGWQMESSRFGNWDSGPARGLYPPAFNPKAGSGPAAGTVGLETDVSPKCKWLIFGRLEIGDKTPRS